MPEEPAENPQALRLLPINPSTFQLAEIAAQLALWDKDGMTPLGPAYIPVRATNEAAFALLFDDEFQQTQNTRWSIGFLQMPSGGSVKDVAVKYDDDNNPNGIFAPRDLGSTSQRWAAIKDLVTIKLKGKEPTDFQTFARAFLYGTGQTDLTRRSPNFLDWYISERLILELLGLAVTLDATKFSQAVKVAMTMKGGRVLALTENKKVSLPVLGIRAGQGLIQSAFIFSGPDVFNSLLGTYRASTSIPSNRMKIKATQFPDFAYGDLFTSAEKGTEGKSVADYIVDFVNGRL
jgi:hypothetical protein